MTWKYVIISACVLAMLSLKACSSSSNPYEMKILSNGLTVIVIPNHKAPVISHMVWYKVGSTDEQEGQTGIAHFLEHMMFKGTSTIPAGILSKMVAQVGGQDNAFTSFDVTAYHQTIPKEQLPMVMKLEADRMLNLKVQQEQFDKEKLVILEERGTRIENKPASRLAEKMREALLKPNPYHNPVIGWQQDIKAITKEQMEQFYHKHYHPGNAVVVIAGDIKPKEAFQLAGIHYGTLPKHEKNERPDVSSIQVVKHSKIEISDENIVLPEWVRYYKAPSFQWGNQKDVFPLMVLASLLGDGETSILYQRLSIEQALASYIDVSYQSMLRGPSIFSIHLIPKHQGINLDVMEAAAEEVIASILSDGITDEEVERIKQSMIASDIYAKEDLKTLGYYYGMAISIGLNPKIITEWDQYIQMVTTEDVKQAASRVLKSSSGFITGKLITVKD